MDKEILFCQTLKAMVRLKKAIDLGFPPEYVDKLDAQVGVFFDKLEYHNLMDDFADFVLQ